MLFVGFVKSPFQVNYTREEKIAHIGGGKSIFRRPVVQTGRLHEQRQQRRAEYRKIIGYMCFGTWN